MKAWALIFPALLVAALLIWAWLTYIHDPDVRRRAVLKSATDSLDQALVLHATRDSLRAARDSTHERLIVKVRVRVDTLVARGFVAESIFVQELPDSLKAPFRSVIAVKDSIIAGLQVIIGEQAQQLALRDTSLVETRVALAVALEQRDDWRKEAKPGFALQVLRDLPKYAIGVAIGVVVGVVLSP